MYDNDPYYPQREFLMATILIDSEGPRLKVLAYGDPAELHVADYVTLEERGGGIRLHSYFDDHEPVETVVSLDAVVDGVQHHIYRCSREGAGYYRDLADYIVRQYERMVHRGQSRQ